MYRKFKILIYIYLILVLFSSCSMLKKSGNSRQNQDHRLENFNFNLYFLEGNKQKMLGNYDAALLNYSNALKVDKTQAAAYYEMAVILNMLQDYSAAMEYAQKSIIVDQTNNEYYRLLMAIVYINNNLLSKSADVYKDLIKLYPRKMEYYFELANLYVKMDKVKDALKVLDNVEKIFGIIDVVSLEKEKYFLYLGDKNSALKEIQKLCNAYPNDVKFKTILAESYVNVGDMGAAGKIYAELEKETIEEGLLYFSIADFYRITKNYDKSFEYLGKGFSCEDIELDFKMKIMISMLENMRGDKYFLAKIKNLLEILVSSYPDDLKVKALYSDYYVFVGDLKSAQRELDIVLEKEKDKYQIWSQALYVDYSLNDMTSMYIRGKEAVELYPNFLEFYKYYIVAAYFTENYKDVVTAVNYASILAINDQSVLLNFLSMQGDAYHKLGQDHESDSIYDMVLYKDMNYVSVLNNYSYFLSIRGERLDKALEMSTRLISVEKNNPTYLDTHAWVLYKNNDFIQALEYIDKAIGLDSKNAVYYEHRGDILYKLSRVDEAILMWEKAKDTGKASDLLQEKIDKKTLIE